MRPPRLCSSWSDPIDSLDPTDSTAGPPSFTPPERPARVGAGPGQPQPTALRPLPKWAGPGGELIQSRRGSTVGPICLGPRHQCPWRGVPRCGVPRCQDPIIRGRDARSRSSGRGHLVGVTWSGSPGRNHPGGITGPGAAGRQVRGVARRERSAAEADEERQEAGGEQHELGEPVLRGTGAPRPIYEGSGRHMKRAQERKEREPVMGLR